MAKDIFSKINIVDYNNSLETILEKKDFSEDVKNLLLSMLYKIENGYNDYEKVKINVETKKQFVKRILNTIEQKCNKIEIIKSLSKESEELEKQNKKYIVDRENGIIKVYQNEKMILNAIIELEQEEIEVDKKYNEYEYEIKEVLKLGNQIGKVEVIRDFDGWSWNIINKEIINENINIIYQNLLMLLNSNILDKWVHNKSFNSEDEEIPSNEILRSKYNQNFGLTKEEVMDQEIVDYVQIIKDILIDKYGEELYNELIEAILKSIIAINANNNKERKDIWIDRKEKNNIELKKMENKIEYLNENSILKKNINLNIKKIDTILNDESLIKEEYEKRNAKLANKDKIFSTSHLVIMLEKERQNYLNEIKRLNKIIEPKEFVMIKNKLENKKEFFNDINIASNKKIDEEKQIINLQKIFLKCIKRGIDDAISRKEIEEYIYKIRYYKFIPYKDIKIGDIDTLVEEIRQIEDLIIQKACDMKVIERLSEDKNLNNEIIRKIFNQKIVDLSTLILVLKYKKGILEVEIYDSNIHEKTEEIEINEKTELSVKLKKKIKLFI